MNRLNLLTQIVRHGGSVGFVLAVHVVAECLAWSVEHYRYRTTWVILGEFTDHTDYATNGSGWFTGLGGEIWQRIIGAKQIRRTIHQYQGRLLRRLVRH